MTKACGCLKDVYTSKPPFLDDGELLVRRTTPTTESSVWESPMIQAKSDAELRSLEEVVFLRSLCLFTYTFLNTYCPNWSCISQR